jgi:hypothetical protein
MNQKANMSQYMVNKLETQSRWVPIKKVDNLVTEESEFSRSVTEYGHIGV